MRKIGWIEYSFSDDICWWHERQIKFHFTPIPHFFSWTFSLHSFSPSIHSMLFLFIGQVEVIWIGKWKKMKQYIFFKFHILIFLIKIDLFKKIVNEFNSFLFRFNFNKRINQICHIVHWIRMQIINGKSEKWIKNSFWSNLPTSIHVMGIFIQFWMCFKSIKGFDGGMD